MKSIIQELSKTKLEEINLTLPSEQLEKEVQAYETIKEYLSDGGAEALDAYVDVVSFNYDFLLEQSYALAFKAGFMLCMEIMNTEEL